MTAPSSHQIFCGDEVLERLRRHAGPGVPLLARCLMVAAAWRHRHVTRRQLRELNDCALQDIGLTRSEALREARKPFWRA
jgi:uncharacterized protein YjiS (DUF1127 family)